MARFSELPSSQWKKVDGVVYTFAKQELYGTYDTFTPEELQQKIDDCGFSDGWYLELETDEPYYDSSARAILMLIGWRQASATELDMALGDIDARKQSMIDRDEKVFSDLKKRRPDLFK